MNKFFSDENKEKAYSLKAPLLLITFFAILAYVPFVPFMGFYSEDFFFSYIGHFYGADGLIKSLSIDRPFNGYLLALFYSFFKDNVFLWHIFVFFIRLIGGFTLFFTYLKIWPKRVSEVTLIVLLFLIYPGFLQQSLPLGYSIWITNLTIWILSLFCSVYAIKSKEKTKQILLTLTALILQINSFLQLEFFIGLEILRLLLITFILENEISLKTISKTVRNWIPYLVSITLFVLWRILIFKSTRQVTDINWVTQTYYTNPIWILKIPLELTFSFIQSIVFAYFIPSLINFIRLPLIYSFITLFAGIFSGLVIYNYLKTIPENEQVLSNRNKDAKKFGKQILLIGVITIIGALIPIILAGRFVRAYLVYDRYIITTMIGASLMLIGFLFFALPRTLRRWIIISLVSLSIIAHILNGFYRIDYWDKQKDLWWQFYWRAPKIENNAMLILDFPKVTEDTPFRAVINKVQWYRFYWVEEQIWTAGNLFFNYDNPPSDHFHGDFLKDPGIAKKIKEGVVEKFNNRNIIYTRDFKKSLIVTTPSDISCLKVVDSKLIKDEPSSVPPREIFGSEPQHGWCYYFQKASLARQLKDWGKLRKLKEEVTSKNLKPKDPSEWLPFTQDMR